MNIKLKLNFILVASLSFFLGGCVIPLEGTKYAELRLGDSGRKQLLIEADDWGGGFTSEGFKGYKHGFYYWFFLQGDGPVYVNPAASLDPLIPTYNGTISIDMERKSVIIKFHSPDDPQALKPNEINGNYTLKAIDHEPFYDPRANP